MSEPKFFFTENSNRRISANRRHIVFEPIERAPGGGMRGVFKATVDEDIEALEALATNPKSGVKAVDADEYDGWLKKKSPDLSGYSPSPTQPPAPSLADGNQARLKAGNVVVVDNPTPESEETPPVDGTPVKVDDVLGEIVEPEGVAVTPRTMFQEAPTEPTPAPEKPHRKNRKADR